MKNSAKRLIAFLLLVCMVLPYIPMPAVAVEEAGEEQPIQVVYDFDLAANYPDDFTNSDKFSVEVLRDTVDAYYEEGTINWTYEGRANGNSKPDGTGTEVVPTANQFKKDFGIYLKNGSGGYGWWYAIRIQAPGTGTYDVTINATYPPDNGDTKHCAWTETYLFDAAQVTGETTIKDLLVEENQMADFDPVVGNHDVEIGAYEFTADHEYILVLRQTQALYIASNDGGRTLHISLADITATRQVGEQAQQVGYDFDLATNHTDVITSTAAFSVEEQKELIDGLYDAGTINWTYVGRADGNSKTDGSGTAVAPTANRFYKDFGIYLKNGNGGQNWWYAIKFRAPGTGTYNVTVNGTYPPENGATKHNAWVETYLLDATGITTAQIAAELTESNRMADYKPVVDGHDQSIGEYSFAGDREYILVFRQSQSLYVAGNDGGRTMHLSLAGLTMDYVEKTPEDTTATEDTTASGDTTVPEGTTAPTQPSPELPESGYNFDLIGVYGDEFVGGGTSVDDQKDKIKAYYDAGLIDWAFEAKHNGVEKSDGTGAEINCFTRNQLTKGSGVNVYTTGFYWWYALRIKSPGAGTYDVTVNTNLVATTDADGNPVKKHSVWTEAYIIDASALTGDKTIDDLLTDANKVKRFAPTVENPDAYIGNVAFEEGKEYILVLRQTQRTYIDGGSLKTANLYLKGLTFEAAEPPVPEKGGYDFDLLTRYPDDFAAGDQSLMEQQEKIRKFYEAGTIDWAFEALQNGVENSDGTGDVADSFYRNQLTKGKGVNVYTRGWYWWYAIRFRSPGAGTYDVTVNTNLVATTDADGNPIKKHSVWTEAYVIDTADLTAGKTINDLLTKENKVKSFAPTVENPDAYIGNVAFEEGKEYILVLRQTQRTYIDGGSLKTANLYLKGLTFEAAEPPEPVKGGYNFDLLTVYPDDFEGGADSVASQKDKIGKFYEEGLISWMYEGNGVAGDSNGKITRNAFLKGKGLQIYTSGYDWWYALRIQSPGKGAYKVDLQSYLAEAKDENGNRIYKHASWVDVYIIEAAALDNGKTTIADSMLKKNKLGTFAPTVENTTAELGYYTFKENREYILILRQTKKTYNAGTEDGLSTTNLYLSSLGFTYTANPPKEQVSTDVIYDFDLGDSKTGIYKSNTPLNEKVDDISRLYSLEELNWKLEQSVSSDGYKFGSAGVIMYSQQDEYAVFRIQSPGKGLYTLSMNHGRSGRGAVGSVYILPVGTQDIAKAIDTHNRVGKLNFYNDTGDVTIEDGFTSLLGTWEFGSAKEYLVVVEAFGKSPYTGEGYMYFSQLVCEKGDTTAKYPAVKQPHSVVVDEAPVKVTEATLYTAVGDVNGHDYFYLPLEGKKMAVYDLDLNTFVSHVDTPFTTCRGIVVDGDGYVWMVGDNSYVFRYDPYLDIGEPIYYYKGTGEGKIPGSSSGQGMWLGTDGCLYFGVYNGGYIAKYDIQTGVFTNLGAHGDDSGAYACTPVYKDGYVYMTLNGDQNGDGRRTYELVKVDAVTGKLIKRLDISDHVSQKEVMLRGMGICGDMLFIGGDQTDVKKLLAVNCETMEIVDYGIYGFMNYGTTPEKDGKIYFMVSGIGIHQYDSATDTVTYIEGFENAGVGMRGNQSSYFTVDNDPLFPGESVVTYKGSIEMPVIMNFETGNTKPISDLVKDEYGSAQTIRAMIKGADGSNQIFLGAYNTSNCSVYDTQEGKITYVYEAQSAQTDAMLLYEGKLYAGNYNAGVLTQVNLDDARRNVSLLSLKSEYHQSRIHVIEGGDGKVFIGSIPDMYQYGGCLGWVDIDTLERYVERNVVQDQSIISLEYYDGYIFGGSSVGGGTGAVARNDLSAKIFVYDVANKTKVAEYDLRAYISGMPEQIGSITGIVADPNVDENHKFWGMTGGLLFSFIIDPETKQIKSFKEEISFDKTSDSSWFPVPMIILDGYLYTNFGTKGGVRKINLSDISDTERLPIPATHLFTIADDGNIYYSASSAALSMYPLNISQADWDVAGKLDDKILALGKVTLEMAETIYQLRAEYEALTWTQKGLVQYLDKLEEAEIDLLEVKIDSIGEVTLEDEALINEIKQTYYDLSAKNKTFVKNYYDVFIPAAKALQAIIDQREADRVQALIDGITELGEITLEDEEAIKEIRAAYDALTTDQRKLVDATLLLEAEAKIKALRQEKIDRLAQLIAQIGEVTLDDEAIITEAMEIYNWLYIDEREQVDYPTLIAAEKALQKLQKAAAAEVDALIEAIGDSVDYTSGDAIAAARAAYDALTPGSKAYVTLLHILEEAEALYAELFPLWAIIVIVVAVVAAGGATAAVLIRKRKKAKAEMPAEET